MLNVIYKLPGLLLRNTLLFQYFSFTLMYTAKAGVYISLQEILVYEAYTD